MMYPPYLTKRRPFDFAGLTAPAGHADKQLRGVPLLKNAAAGLGSKLQTVVEVVRRCLTSIAIDAKYLRHFG